MTGTYSVSRAPQQLTEAQDEQTIPTQAGDLTATIVIPTYNEERNIARLVEQILAEPWRNGIALDRIVIVDDCSSDSTQAITEDLARQFEQVQVIRHSERGGKNAGMRTGYAACRSQVVYFVDADVLLGKECLTKMLHLLRDDPALTGVSCVVAPLPARSWREWAPQWQAQFIAGLSRLGHGSLARVYAIRANAIAPMTLPDDTADDLYTMRWLRNHHYTFAVRPDAEAYVRTTSGLRDFAKQTLRIWLSRQAMEEMLPPKPHTVVFAAHRHSTVLRAAARASWRVPLGFPLYLLWRGIIRVTPPERWLPSFDHSRYDTSESTKDLDEDMGSTATRSNQTGQRKAPSLLQRVRKRSGAMTFTASSDGTTTTPPPDSRLMRVAELVTQHLGRERRVLDIGCWTGGLARALDTLSTCTYTGVDIEAAAQAIEAAQSAAPHHRFLVVPTVEDLPFESASFDVVTLTEVIEHVAPGHEGAVLGEMARVLHVDGCIIFSTPFHNVLTPLDPAWFFGHRHYSAARLEALARSQGLRIVDISFTGGFWTACDINLLYVYKHILRRSYSTPRWLAALKKREAALTSNGRRLPTTIWCRMIHDISRTSNSSNNRSGLPH